MRIPQIIILLLALTMVSCMDNIGMKPNANIASRADKDLAYWICVTTDQKKDDASYIKEFKNYRSIGLNIILVDSGTDSLFVDHLVALAEEEGLEVHTALGIPEMDIDDLEKAIEQAKKNGTKRAFFFNETTLTKEQFQVIKTSQSK